MKLSITPGKHKVEKASFFSEIFLLWSDSFKMKLSQKKICSW